MLGSQNPSAHELVIDQDPQEALEYLALVSLLHRRLDNSLRRRLMLSPLQNVVGTGVAVDRLILADFSCRAPGWKIEQVSWLYLLTRNSGLPRTVLVKLGVPLGSKRVVKFAPQLGRGANLSWLSPDACGPTWPGCRQLAAALQPRDRQPDHRRSWAARCASACQARASAFCSEWEYRSEMVPVWA